jgi:hypothetical protein
MRRLLSNYWLWWGALLLIGVLLPLRFPLRPPPAPRADDDYMYCGPMGRFPDDTESPAPAAPRAYPAEAPERGRPTGAARLDP